MRVNVRVCVRERERKEREKSETEDQEGGRIPAPPPGLIDAIRNSSSGWRWSMVSPIPQLLGLDCVDCGGRGAKGDAGVKEGAREGAPGTKCMQKRRLLPYCTSRSLPLCRTGKA